MFCRMQLRTIKRLIIVLRLFGIFKKSLQYILRGRRGRQRVPMSPDFAFFLCVITHQRGVEVGSFASVYFQWLELTHCSPFLILLFPFVNYAKGLCGFNSPRTEFRRPMSIPVPSSPFLLQKGDHSY